MQQEAADAEAQEKSKVDFANLKDHMRKLKLTSPIGKELVKLACTAKTWDEMAEIMCMLEEVKAHEKQICSYCKSPGHRHAKCDVFKRLRNQTRGDRAINKKRGHKSAELRYKARKPYKGKTLKFLGVKR